MFYWSSFPFVRILLPFILGVVSINYTRITINDAPVFIVFVLLFILFLVFHTTNKSFSKRWVSGALVGGLFFLLGFTYAAYSIYSLKPPAIALNTNYDWAGKVNSITYKNQKVKSILVRVKQIRDSNNWEQVNFNVLISNRDSTLIVEPGDLISASSFIKRTMAPQNPAQFNYQEFLANKNIYYTAFEDNYLVAEGRNSIHKFAHHCRMYVVNIYKAIGIEKDELAVLVALTLGDKSQLSFELKTDFAGAGAMHILAVSGLHVGIIFLLFSSLLKFLPDKKFYRILKGSILLIVIWLFAFLAGLSPSVQRAAWMFSFVIVSKMMNKNSNILNSISVSALLLILIDPNVIYQIGFMLSYSAVVGIILIHPIVYGFFNSKYWLIDKAWSLLVVSIAAQIATLPFTLYFFHQFPNYFLLTNLIVIPLAFVIVSGGIISSLVFIGFGTDLFLGVLLNWVLTFLNRSVSAINQIPYAISDGIWISLLSFILLFFIVWISVYFLHSKKPKHLITALSFLFILMLNEFVLDLINLKSKQLTFYSLSQPSFSIINGLTGEIYSTEKSKAYDFKLIRDHLQREGVGKIIFSQIIEENELIEFNEVLICVNSNHEIKKIDEIGIDYLIVTKEKEMALVNNVTAVDYLYRKPWEVKKIQNIKKYHNVKYDGALKVIMD